MNFTYSHSESVSDLKQFYDSRKLASTKPKGFGSTAVRFELEDICPTPGVGSYTIHKTESMLPVSPSISKKGSYSSKSLRLTPHKDKGHPGPGQYNLPDLSYLEPHQRRPSTAFVASGKGRVPFPDPKPYPGPSDYVINHDPGVSPVLKKKISASFASKSGRESFFDKVPPGAHLTYKTEASSLSANHDLAWHKSTFVRMQQIGYDNRVPGCHVYFDDRASYDKQRKSLRSVGNFRGTHVGKLNEKGVRFEHTFGADKDRFKNSVYGRLDLKALIPAPGHYDDIYRYAKERAKSYREQIESASSSCLSPPKPRQTPSRSASSKRIGTAASPAATPGDTAPSSAKSPIPFDPVHSFGADTDRFKNTYFGRLDLKAEDPGPGVYDDIFRFSKERDASHRLQSATGGGGAGAQRSWTPAGGGSPPSPQRRQVTTPGVAASAKLGSRMLGSAKGGDFKAHPDYY